MHVRHSAGHEGRVASGEASREPILRLRAEMHLLLRQSIARRSISGHEGPFVRFLADWAEAAGLDVDLWQARDEDLQSYPEAAARHLPLEGRPTLLLSLPGNPDRRSILFNAHSDVVGVPEPKRWTHDPWQGVDDQGRIYGRGACDVKGPLVSAIWAMLAIRQELDSDARGAIRLEVVPGEEDCVGLGSLTSLVHGVDADGLVVLEPTENQPRCASRSGCRFEIVCSGRAVHGTVKWLGRDAIALLRHVLEALEAIERRWNGIDPDPLYAGYPIARPITVDTVNGGQWQGMVCDRCMCAGYLELLPRDSIEAWQKRLCDELNAELVRRGRAPEEISIRFTEQYAGCRTSPGDPFCTAAASAAGISPASWAGFNSGCEAGLRQRRLGTPTLVWGPGSLEQAHAVDEFVRFDDVQSVATAFVQLIRHWTTNPLPSEVTR